MFADEITYFLLIVLTQELPNHLLSDIPTDILVIIAFAAHFLLLDLLENMKPATCCCTWYCWLFTFGLWLLGSAEDYIGVEVKDRVPDERAFSIGDFIGVRQELTDERVS